MTTQTQIAPDEKIFNDMIATVELFSVYLGRTLGLYEVLADHDWATEGEISSRAATDQRYTREWLEQQAVAGLLDVEDPTVHAAARRYRLDPQTAAAVLHAEDPAHVGPLAEMVVGVAGALPQVIDAYRTGAGVPYVDYGADFREGQAAINRPAFTTDLIDAWIPATDGLVDILNRPGARVADLGCGFGWSTVAVAAAFPQAQVVGVDSDRDSIEGARAIAATTGSTATFVEADAATIGEHGRFDVVFVLESLHDMAQPIAVLAGVRDALKPGGVVVIADEAVAEQFEITGDPLERMMYGWSILHCLPASRAEEPSAAIGTVIRPDTVFEIATQAGFGRTDVVDVDGGFFRIYRLER